MKTNNDLLALLQKLWSDEVIAINQHVMHCEMCESWGYNRLFYDLRKKAMDEIFHSESIMERIIELEGTIDDQSQYPLQVCTTVTEIINNDTNLERNSLRSSNAAVKLAREVDDQDTLNLLSWINKREMNHLAWAKHQLVVIRKLGIDNYLVINK
jgi:bacterioferritin